MCLNNFNYKWNKTNLTTTTLERTITTETVREEEIIDKALDLDNISLKEKILIYQFCFTFLRNI